MVTNVNDKTYDLRGLSTDEKPVENWVGNGSTFIEMDTGNIFMYDAENKLWRKIKTIS